MNKLERLCHLVRMKYPPNLKLLHPKNCRQNNLSYVLMINVTFQWIVRLCVVLTI